MNNQNNQNIPDNRNTPNNQNKMTRQPSQNIQNIQNKQNNPNNPNNPSRPNPGLPQSPQSRMPQRSKQRSVQDARSVPNSVSHVTDANMMAEEFHKERTQIFDSMSNEKGIKRSNLSNSANPANPADLRESGDGVYHYTGKSIQSSRQKFTDVSPRTANSADSRTAQNRQKTGRAGRNGRYNDDDMSVSEYSKKTKKNLRAEAKARSGGFIMSGILKAVLYIAGVVLVSIIIAYNIISIANDVFAFMKEPLSANVAIPRNATIEDISKILYEKDIIKYPGIFNFYLNYRKKDKTWEFVEGTYQVSASTNYDDLISQFRKQAEALQTIRITVPEGWTIDQIIDKFVAEGMGTREKFVEIINKNPFSEYRFVQMLNETELSPDRKYRLEGYLFPDTYEFYTTESELSIITKFLNNFAGKFTEDFYNRCDTLGMTVDEVINLASIVEREAMHGEDYPKIAAVLHNRLIYNASFPFLESDATILYSLGEHKADLTQADLKEDLPYNTYTRKGLPPSAICNPGYDAIYDTLFPTEDFPYFFFVANMNTGEVYYAETNAEHERNKIIAQSEQ